MIERALREATTQLDKRGYRMTNNRARVFRAIWQHEEALSLTDLELILYDMDKSTIFRTLQLFSEVGILHRIDDGTGSYKYAPSAINGEEISKAHAHFFCTRCERTFCIEGIPTPCKLALPDGFTSESLNVVIHGVCASCQRGKTM